MKNIFEEIAGILGRKTEPYMLAFCPKPSPTVFDRLIDVHCCAVTCVHQLVCGGGRHLADHPAELPHELPQVGMRRTTKRTIQNQYNKNNTLVDHDRLRSHRNIGKEPEDPEAKWSFGTSEFAYLRYFQYRKSPTMNFVTEYAYSKYSQNRKMMDPEPSIPAVAKEDDHDEDRRDPGRK